MAKIRKVNILGVNISKVTMKEAVEVIEDFVVSGRRQRHIVTANPEFIIQAQKDNLFRRILNKADLAVPDGIGLVAAAKLLEVKSEKLKVKSQNTEVERFKKILFTFPTGFLHGLKIGFALLFYRRYFDILPEPVPGIDLIYKLSERAAKRGYKIFLLGGQEDGAPKSARNLSGCYPKLKVEAYKGAEILEEETEEELEKTLAKINRFAPDILLVAYGFPKQDFWIDKNLPLLNCKVAIGVGSAFDVISGQVKRAPLLLRRLGLEWLWRLFFGRTSLKRILTASVVFPFKAFLYKLRHS